MIVSDRFRLALQTALAMALAYGIALAMDWSKPMWAGVFCGGVIHILVMPQLAGFWALAALLFTATFWICWHNHLPSQGIGKAMGLAFMPVILTMRHSAAITIATTTTTGKVSVSLACCTRRRGAAGCFRGDTA